MSIRIARTEAWALQIVQRVKSGQRVEDSRVELKAGWPDCEKAARRIAGHANASFGSDVLWIVGLDEVNGVVGAGVDELADWWSKVRSFFDGVSPSLADLVLAVDGQTLACLLFETSRPPYVVKNLRYGTPGGGSVEWEVPWREGTSLRTATRNDLVRLLVPTVTRPELEVLGGYGGIREDVDFPRDVVKGVVLSFTVNVYVSPRSDQTAVIPFHRCQLIVTGASNSLDCFDVSLRRPFSIGGSGSRVESVTMDCTAYELIAHGPGRCSINAEARLQSAPAWLTEAELRLRFVLPVIDCELPIVVEVDARPATKVNNQLMSWELVATKTGSNNSTGV